MVIRCKAMAMVVGVLDVYVFFFFSSRRRHTRLQGDWSSDVCSSDLRGDRVELRGFGAFSVKHRPARTGRNPRTGAHVSVDRKSVPFFKTGKEMRERLNRT